MIKALLRFYFFGFLFFFSIVFASMASFDAGTPGLTATG